MIVNYSSDSEDHHIIQKKFKKGILVNPIPEISIDTLQKQKESEAIEIYNKELAVIIQSQQKNHLTGKIDKILDQSHFNFQEQYHNFLNQGYAYDPVNKDKIVLNQNIHPELFKKMVLKGEDIDFNQQEILLKGAFISMNKEEKEKAQQFKRKREKSGTAATGDYLGPWAKYEEENLKQIEVTQEQKQKLQQAEKQRQEKIEESKVKSEFQASTEYHGDQEFKDYKGRSYILPPSDVRNHDHVCYIPKKCIHIWQGHTKGVQSIRLFPQYGHFLLSGSLDTTIKLWSTRGQKKLTRTYYGHSEAIRDLYFTNDGLHFLSAGYDKCINYWDTEYGKVVKSFKIKNYPFCVRFNPKPEYQHSFMMGSSNKKIAQYDCRTGTRSQLYDEHLGAINSITFFDNARKFASCSDDKKIFIWEYGIPVVIKHISEPEQHATTYSLMHPSQKYWAGQANNNCVQVYDTKVGNFRKNTKKKYSGHKSASYTIGLSFSPDGQFLASGDSEGRAFFWDWKSQKTYRVLDAHNGICNGIEWHPIEPSKVVTCGWDGLIKYWD